MPTLRCAATHNTTATKCDDISPSEVIRPLRLDEDPELQAIEARLTQIDDDTRSSKKKKREAGKVVKGILISSACSNHDTHLFKDLEAELSGIREQLRDHQLHLEALENGETFVSTLNKSKSGGKKRKNKSGGRKDSPKRRRSVADSDDEDDDFIDDSSDEDKESDSDEQDSDDEDGSEHGSDEDLNNDQDMEDVSAEDLEEKIKQLKLSMKSTRELLSDARDSEKEADASIASLAKSHTKVQREKNGFCSLKRSEVRLTDF